VSLAIPDQVGVIGVDNEISICETMRPPLTSILPDFEKCGYNAAEMLMQKILNPHKPLKEWSYGVRAVFERESSMDINGSTRLVTQARKYIAAHYPEQMNINSVAKHLGTCRRRLELKFRMVTGGTVREEIERTRLNNARRLLSNTNLPIGEIAAASGYGSEAGFRLAFGKAERMSPRAYRTSSRNP
jgi:LacI family transcriptional regulator